MTKRNILFLFILFLGACASYEEEVIYTPDYNRIAQNAHVVSKSPYYVTYEYKNIRVDEIAPIAAEYCFSRGERQASLYEITMHRNNARRATFSCEKIENQ